MINQHIPVKIEEYSEQDQIHKNELAALGISKNKVLTRNDKLRIFKYRNKLKITKLIYDDFDRKIYFSYIE